MHKISALLGVTCLLLCVAGCGGSGSSTSNPVYGSDPNNPEDHLVSPNIVSVTYGNGVFVAVGGGGGGNLQPDVPYGPWVDTSTDGVNWATQNSGNGSNANGTYDQVVYGSGGFLAVDNKSAVFKSPDGVAWTQISQSAVGVSWDGAEYLIPIQGLQPEFAKSTDGINWLDVQIPPPQDAPISVTKVKNTYYGLGFSGDGLGIEIETSPDLAHWTPVPGVVNYKLETLTYAGGLFVSAGTGGVMVTSRDGATWTPLTPVTSDQLLQIAYNGSAYVAIGNNGTVITSPDGSTWTVAIPGGSQSNSFLPGALAVTPGGVFVTVSGYQSMASMDGVHWKPGFLGSIPGVSFR